MLAALREAKKEDKLGTQSLDNSQREDFVRQGSRKQILTQKSGTLYFRNVKSHLKFSSKVKTGK